MQKEIIEIPEGTERDICSSVRKMILKIMARPGGIEAIEKKKAEIRERREDASGH